MRHLLTALIVCLAAAAGTGCGGDDAGDSTRSEPGAAATATAVPSATGFVAEAEAICARANEQEAALGAPGVGWINSEYVEDLDFLEDFNAIGRSALRELRKLAAPDQHRERFATVLESIARMARGIDKQIGGLRTGRAGGDAVEIYERGYMDLAAAGGPIGFSECLGILL